MFEALKDKESEFYDSYLKSFCTRNAVSSTIIESDSYDITDYNNSIAISGLLEASESLLFRNEIVKFSPFDLPNLISKITNGEINTYRKSEVMIKGRNVNLSHQKDIIPDLYILFDNYYKIWSYLDNPFLREAMFHIHFTKIHPFEDGNGRLARLIVSFNLIKQNIAPVIIPRELKSRYCDFLEKEDYEGLANMFKELSAKEQIIMQTIFNGKKSTHK